MAAPVSIVHTHVHSMRTAHEQCAGAEALVARVRAADGTEGYGFTLNDDAGAARDMAAWDALGRSKGVPLYGLLGGTYRRTVKCVVDENPAISPDWTALRKDVLADRFDLLRIDPFAWGSVEQVTTLAAVAQAFDLGVALLAPNAHPWEIRFCAALAAAIKGEDTRIIVRTAEVEMISVSELPGMGIDWALEPSFGKLQWQG